MKLSNLIKIIPFLSTFLLIIFLYASNNKVNTNLKLLIWKTPTLSLGSYIAISTGAGFIFSYVITTNLSYKIKHKSVNTLQYKDKVMNEDINEFNFTNIKNNSEKILIERNINDPSPTMNAKFRVIGKTEMYNNSNNNDGEIQYENEFDYEESYNDKNETIKDGKNFTTDWNDDSFASW